MRQRRWVVRTGAWGVVGLIAVGCAGGSGGGSPDGGSGNGGGGNGGSVSPTPDAGGGSGGAAGNGTLAPPLLSGPCDWRGVGEASDLRFSPDGKLLVVAGASYLKVFDAATGAHRRPTPIQPGYVTAVTFSPDGKWMAAVPQPATMTGPGARPASVWRTEDSRQGGQIGRGRNVFSVAFSPDSTHVAVLVVDGDTAVLLFRLADLSMVASVPLSEPATGVLDFSPDGATLVLTADQSVQFPGPSFAWNTATWSPVTPVPRLATNPALPRTDHTEDYAPANGRSVYVMRTNVTISGRYWVSPGTADFTAVAISHDGTMVVAADATGHVYVWRVPQSFLDQLTTEVPLLQTFSAQVGNSVAVAFSPDDAQVASLNKDGTLFVWRVSDGAVAWHADGVPPGYNVVDSKLFATDPASGVLLVGGGHDTAYALDPTSDRVMGKLTDASLSRTSGCAASRDGRALACPEAERVHLLTVDAPATLVGSSVGGNLLSRSGVALSPDHRNLIEVITDLHPPAVTDVLSWTPTSAATGTTLARVESRIGSLAFSADGTRLAAVVPIGQPLRLWNPASGASLGQWGPIPQPGSGTGYQTVAISADGTRLAAVGDGIPKLLLATTAAGAGDVREIVPGDGAIGYTSVVFSPDASLTAVGARYVQTPATASTDDVERGGAIVRTADGAVLYSLPISFRGLGFVSNDKLVRAEADGTVTFWCLP